MAKRKRTKEETVIYKTTQNTDDRATPLNTGVPKGLVVPTQHVALVVLLL
jgi:hypothetical protein